MRINRDADETYTTQQWSQSQEWQDAMTRMIRAISGYEMMKTTGVISTGLFRIQTIQMKMGY